MKIKNRLIISTLFLMILLCFAFISLTPPQDANRQRVSKKKTIIQIIDYLQLENGKLEDKMSRSISESVYAESMRYNIDYRLILAIMKVESNFKNDAVSHKGARGLLQVKPFLAKYIAEDVGIRWLGDKTLDEPEKNIKIGVHFFSKLIEDFRSIKMALHAYHVGPMKLREILTKKKIPQERYLRLVLNEYEKNLSLLPEP
jgi:soluble lytic murein transglycosylase